MALVGLGGTSNTFENPITVMTPQKGLSASSNTFGQYSFPFGITRGLRAGSNTFTPELGINSFIRISKNYQI